MAQKVSSYLDTKIEFLKGVGPTRAELLQKELNIFTFADLFFIFPFRYVDRTRFHQINEVRAGDSVQLKGVLLSLEIVRGQNNKRRLVGMLKDGSGFVELVWFSAIQTLKDMLKVGETYTVYGKVNTFSATKSITHPEMEQQQESADTQGGYFPVYSSTEKLDKRGITQRVRRRWIEEMIKSMPPDALPETLPDYIIKMFKFCTRQEACIWLHFPASDAHKTLATNRMKFAEIFFLQLRMLFARNQRQQKLAGILFPTIGDYFNTFYNNHLGFELTGAQKRVLKEIRHDLGSGRQMNRLLQGDVGSGKTIVGLLTMLMAVDNGFQACLVAPTEILAQQHYQSISEQCSKIGVRVGFLSGNVKGKQRKTILDMTRNGDLHILIGTHALFEEWVVFKELGLVIIDEQHRFGVAQRATLWHKREGTAPHVLVMTATPIPRTLAMTVYGDLETSKIDELPPGRKPIKTVHRTDRKRMEVVNFMRDQIDLGRQIYVVFPLIEESETLDLQNLQTGYEQLTEYFPLPQYQVSVVHGKMKPADKDLEMQRFVAGKTNIMVATTVIEVGVNVPNASVMVIENAERFGLSQLHQLRGRVGRGADQSFCILMTGYKVSKEAKFRIETMVRTNDGFEIAEADLKLRGPGDIEGTQQSGILELNHLNLIEDTPIMETARKLVDNILDRDPELTDTHNVLLKSYLAQAVGRTKEWGRIS